MFVEFQKPIPIPAEVISRFIGSSNQDERHKATAGSIDLPREIHESRGALRNFSSLRPSRTRSAFKRVLFSIPSLAWFSTAAASSLRCILGRVRPKRLMIRKRLATKALDQVVEFAITPGRAMQTSTPSFPLGNF